MRILVFRIFRLGNRRLCFINKELGWGVSVLITDMMDNGCSRLSNLSLLNAKTARNCDLGRFGFFCI